ncbi:Nif3-like dinuclear metal center hexameric protein, partial [Salmonella sp. SKLX063344]
GKIKESLNIANLRVYGEIDKKVSKIAVCGGSGAEFIWDAYNSGADVYITGDIKYHDAQYGHELGLTIIDAGHYDTEKIILPAIKDYIRKEVNEDIYIRVIMESSLPVHIY